MFSFTELFAGVGGFSAALERLGGTNLGSCEIESQARQTHQLNFNHTKTTTTTTTSFAKDVRCLLTLPISHDILTGGFPCQPFSRAGHQPGFTTPKGTLFHEIVRLLKKSQPRMFLLENVTGLLNLGTNKNELPTIIREELEGVSNIFLISLDIIVYVSLLT